RRWTSGNRHGFPPTGSPALWSSRRSVDAGIGADETNRERGSSAFPARNLLVGRRPAGQGTTVLLWQAAPSGEGGLYPLSVRIPPSERKITVCRRSLSSSSPASCRTSSRRG